MKILYNKDTKHEIVDVSGKKTLDQIKFEFGDGDYEEETLDADDGYRIKNDKIIKYSIKEETDLIIADKKSKKQASIDRIKVKLGLSDKDIEDLMEIT